MKHRRLAFFLPNIFTALNLGCGFASITLGLNGHIYGAAMLLVLGAVFDSVDGRVARMTGTESSFGEQFDSMSDVVSFGLAPSLLMYRHFLEDLGRLGLIGAFFFLLCGALRLARFNASIGKQKSEHFQGLPIPGAAMALVGYALWSLSLEELNTLTIVSLTYVLLISLLMISNIPFFSFKSDWTKKHKRMAFFLAILVIVALFINEKMMIGVVINIYILCSLVYFVLNKKKTEHAFHWNGEDEYENNR